MSPKDSNTTQSIIDTSQSNPLVVPFWINGKETFTTSTFDVVSPATGESCWQSASSCEHTTLQAIEAAQRAFPAWSKTKPTVRRAILLEAADLLEARADENAGYMQTEVGANVPGSRHFVVPQSVRMLRDIAGRISTICGTVPVSEDEGTSAMVWKEPYGVILSICAWNAPYFFGVRSAATALATGNTVILKASELSPRCYWALGKAFHDAGVPPGVLNIISCPPSDGAKITNMIIEHPAVRKVDFTGSAAVGRKIAGICGQNLKPCLMELGGKNSAIILPNADLAKSARACILGGFLNGGQVCMATSRIILHHSIADSFLSSLKLALEAMYPPSSTTPVPTIISQASVARLESLLSTVTASGAKIFHKAATKDTGAAAKFSPVVLSDVPEDHLLAKEEAFGPILSYVVVQDEDEAVRVANDSEYGLVASIFTEDLRKALAIAKRIEAGVVHINSNTLHDEPALPMGGVKNSGWGRFNAQQGMEEFLVMKTVTWHD